MADPHVGLAPLHLGAPLAEAAGVVVRAHGRGATAQSILALAPEIGEVG